MKKFLSLVLVALMLLTVVSMTSCAKEKTLDDIKAAGVLVMYTEAGFAPYEFLYENEIVGVDVEIMKKVAEKIGVELQIEDVLFDNIIGSVQSGKADVGAAGITINAERLEEVNFSVPYASTEQYVIVKADNTEITTLETLKGKEIGVQQGTTSDFMIEDLIQGGTLEGSKLTPYNAPAIAAASLGKIDAVVTDKLTALNIAANSNGAYKTFKLVKADGSDAAEVEEYGIAVNKKNAELLAVINEVLNELIADGSIAAWENQYNELYSGLEAAE